MPSKPRPHTTLPTGPPDPEQQRKLDSRNEDAQIIQAALSGNDRAYKLLMNKYHDAIFSFIYRMIHDREQVEDLTQEAFIKAFASLGSFNDEYAFSTWLYKIATNNCIDYIRKRKLQTFSIDKPIEARDSDFTFELSDDSYEADKELISGQRARQSKPSRKSTARSSTSGMSRNEATKRSPGSSGFLSERSKRTFSGPGSCSTSSSDQKSATIDPFSLTGTLQHFSHRFVPL
jgi:RNA polymerase sigma factor (sigma-70 family)